MPTEVKSESSRTHSNESSFVSLFSGWAQQGVQSFFATQRILVDLAMRQNASLMHSVRQQLSSPEHSPSAILSEAAAEGVANFIEGQKVLLDLAQKQNEILLNGVKERVGEECPAGPAVVDLLRRSVETFIDMQQEFLKIAGKQTHSWVEAAKAGKPYDTQHLVETAREAMDHFVKTQNHFMDVVAEETTKAISSKPANSVKKTKKTELSQIAREATESFINAQKKLVDVAGRQMNAEVKSAGKAVELLRPFPLLPLAEMTREGVKSYVDAQKALVDVVVKPNGQHKTATKVASRAKRSPKKAAAAAA
jgi:predicted nucleic-acid-binding protein